ncbi:MAG: efflux RND transporter permease subunit [Acidobacteria bacterium]|nr:efflux RND transporter permease subunit [Acidobacteriota bacterium]
MLLAPLPSPSLAEGYRPRVDATHRLIVIATAKRIENATLLAEIMMISHIKHLMDEERVDDFRKAVIRGAVGRVSPILMTALAAGLALIPLALRAGNPGSEIEAPMAMVILFGLLSSTALNMVVVPAIYYRFRHRAKQAD